jgi:glycosyltransferase involved in cell wall biosynthesis
MVQNHIFLYTYPMARKKVLYLITKSNWGGAQRYVYDLATRLPDGYEPVVVGGAGGVLLEKLKQASIRTVHIPALARDIDAFNDFSAVLQLYRLIRKERPHIVHLNSSKAGFLGAIAARCAGVTHIVFTVHGWPFNEPVSKLSKFIRWCAILVTMLLVHRTITVSRFATMLAPLGIHTKTIHNGIAPIDFLTRDEARAEICARAGIPSDSFIFGTIAELHINKGIDILIEATYLVDNVQVVVIGEGEERQELEFLIRELKLEDRVHLIGFLDSAARYLKAFDAFILPSRTEALGYVLLEAGAAEVPVIASAVGGIPEVIHDQVSGDLFHAFNDLALAESMQIYKTSPNTIRHYSEALKAHVDRYFNLDIMVQKTLIAYER